jgi:LysM repeat protein
MKWKHWSILIILVLFNYLIFSTAFNLLAKQRQPSPRGTRTPQPTFESMAPTVAAWIVLPTSTVAPTRTPITPSPTPILSATLAISGTEPFTASGEALAPTATLTPPGQTVTHKIKKGETLSEIAKQYGVTQQAIMDANGLENANRIITGQELIIPLSGEVTPAATKVAATKAAATKPPATKAPTTKPPTPKPTQKPPTATSAPAATNWQFTAEIVWAPLVAPNCSGPAISKESQIRDLQGNPVNGVRVEVDCYGNVAPSHLSGNPGEYEPGHYDFSFGQSSPQDWTCTARVLDINGQAVTSSQTATIHFDTNDCRPYGNGHQVAILNWTKNW